MIHPQVVEMTQISINEGGSQVHPTSIKSTATSKKSSYRPDIDGLRAVAVIAVLIYHVDNTWLPGGFMGVDIFFAISGFVVTLSLLRRPKHQDTKMSDYLLQFYKRRLMRLAPSLIVCLLATVLLMTFLIPSWWPNKMDWYVTGAYSVFGMSNLQLAFQESKKGYFDIDGDPNLNPFLHTWSLGVEEQFYLVYPIILAVGTSSSSSCQVHTLLILFAVVSLILSCVFAFTVKQQVGFYFSPARFWEMAAGGCSVLVMQCYEDTFKRMNGMVSLLVDLMVVGILATTFAFGHTLWPYSPFPFPLAFLPVLATCLFMCLGSSERNVTNLLLSKKPAVYIGKLSYGLYLVHWPIFVILRFHVDFQNSWVLFALVLSFILACLMHHGIEKNCKSKGMQPKKLFVLLILVQIVMALFAAIPFNQSGLENTNNNTNSTHTNLFETFESSLGCACRYESDEKDLPFHRPINVTKNIGPLCYTRTRVQKRPDYASRSSLALAYVNPSGSWGQQVDGKYVGYPTVAEFKERLRVIFGRYPRKPNTPHIFLVGDSTGNQISVPVALSLIGTHTFSNLYAYSTIQIMLFGRGAPLINGINLERNVTLINALFDTVGEMMTSKDDILVLAFRQTHKILSQNDQEVLTSARQRIFSNAKIFLFDTPGDLPRAGYEYLLPNNQDKLGARQETLDEGERKVYFDALESFANSDSNTYFFKISQLFCQNEYCGPWIPGTRTLAFWDEYHLTPAASYYLWPFLCDLFATVI